MQAALVNEIAKNGDAEYDAGVMRTLIKVSLFDVTSENDLTLLEENGEYFVNFADRIGTYRDFVEMLFEDDEIYPDLVTADVCANFFILIKSVSERWNDQMAAVVS